MLRSGFRGRVGSGGALGVRFVGTASQPRHLLALLDVVLEEDRVGEAVLGDLAVEPQPSISSSWVPRATTAPCSSTMISSASAIVERRWAMMNVVRPAIASRSPRLIARLGGRVDRGGGVVEDQDARVGEQRAGDRDPLALAAGEREAALADARVVAVGESLDELVGLGEARRRSRSPRGVASARA